MAQNFTQTLAGHLPKSNSAERDTWVKQIVREKIPIEELIPLLAGEHKIASRTLWLFSQVAKIDPAYLRPHLCPIYEGFVEHKIKGGEVSIANQWLMCGIPEEMESLCIDQLFVWIQSSETDITTKSRSIKALLPMSKKYPELCNELCISLDKLRGNYSNSFDLLLEKTLSSLKREN